VESKYTTSLTLRNSVLHTLYSSF